MHKSVALVVTFSALLCAACASYTTPGAAARFADLDRVDSDELASRQASPRFPANIAMVQLQASGYESYSAESYGSGRFSVVQVKDMPTPAQLQAIATWSAVKGAAALDHSRLPEKLDSLKDLRFAAIQQQADVLLVYTLDTVFKLGDRAVKPADSIKLGKAPEGDAHIATTASAIFIDARTGLEYGKASASAQADGLADAWSSADAVDGKRQGVERQAIASLLAESEKTWNGIAQGYR